MNILGTAVKNTKGLDASNVRELGYHLPSFPSYGSEHDIYENVYEDVRPIASRFSSIVPYAIDGNGKPLEGSVPAIDSLFLANKQMDFVTFMDAVAVGVKVNPEVNLLVWRKSGRRVIDSGRITKDNIGGYTFLGMPTTDISGNKCWEVTKKDGSTETYYPNEVLTFTDSLNPANLGKGYSPAQAAHRWATIDDYLADYQAGFFSNGAVPAGMFQVVAPTKKEFNDVVSSMKEKHRGAKNNNNVSYSHTPIDPATGKPASVASVTWVPFNQANKDLELGTLFENVNNKLSAKFGTPSIMKGQDGQATYSNAQTARQGFAEDVLEPFVTKFYSQLTYGLNRITGGLGYAIVADVDIPTVADQEKTEAETKAIEGEIILKYTSEPYNWSLSSVVDAFRLSNSYKLLSKDQVKPKIENDKPQVDEGGEVQNSPDPEAGTTGDVVYVKDVKKKTINETGLEGYEYDLTQALNGTLDYYANGGEDEDQAIEETVAILLALMLAIGTTSTTEAMALASSSGYAISTPPLFIVDEAELRQHVTDVIRQFNGDTKLAVAELAGSTDEWKQSQAYRIDRLVKNESWIASQGAQLAAYTIVATAVGALASKTWVAQVGACSLCQPLNGKTVGIAESFGDVSKPPLHVSCRCDVKYSFAPPIKKIHCKECSRYMGDTRQTDYQDELKCKCGSFGLPDVRVQPIHNNK